MNNIPLNKYMQSAGGGNRLENVRLEERERNGRI
jgi:hypothetical protein